MHPGLQTIGKEISQGGDEMKELYLFLSLF